MHITTADIWDYKSNWKTMYIYSNQRKYNQKKRILYIKILKLQEKPSHKKLNKKKKKKHSTKN
jgi:hypothetical protein